MTLVTMNPGQILGLAAHLLLPDGYTLAQGPFTWMSSNTSVASVTVNTLWVNDQPTARIAALTLGSAVITCTSGILSSTVNINVVPEPDPSSLVISVGVVSKGWRTDPNGWGNP